MCVRKTTARKGGRVRKGRIQIWNGMRRKKKGNETRRKRMKRYVEESGRIEGGMGINKGGEKKGEEECL
jgi:hypothetical protein